MALSILWVSIFMTSILFANICVISPGFVSVSRLCPKCHIWAHNPWNEHICQLNKKTYADSSFCKPTYVDNFFLFPFLNWPWPLRPRRLFVCQTAGDSWPCAVFLAKSQAPVPIHPSQCSCSWQGEAMDRTLHFLFELWGGRGDATLTKG